MVHSFEHSAETSDQPNMVAAWIANWLHSKLSARVRKTSGTKRLAKPRESISSAYAIPPDQAIVNFIQSIKEKTFARPYLFHDVAFLCALGGL